MSFQLDLGLGGPVETFEFLEGDTVSRIIKTRSGDSQLSTVNLDFDASGMAAAEAYDLAWLRSTKPPRHHRDSPGVRIVDLFSGCGGLSLGLFEACRALGMKANFVLANDIDPDILAVYSDNLAPRISKCSPIEAFFDGGLGDEPTEAELEALNLLGESPSSSPLVDVLIGGPPCQGHSDFNNHTRNDDPKNSLYMRMARFCEVVAPTHVIIENVPGVARDRGSVAQRTWAALRDLGYEVSSGVVDASAVGVAQKRRRSITLATRSRDFKPSVDEAIRSAEVKEPRSALWAIKDLAGAVSTRAIDSSTSPNAETFGRISYLFDNDLYDLPDDQRPDCHRLKHHSYKSVYGRMYPDRPAQTLTTGFTVMGRGRFVHPTERRTITPHEAARLQFFPDFFDFGERPRTLLSRVIGNAVPPKLGYVLGLHLLR